MKNRVKYLAILFFAFVGLSSCNPDSPDTLQPSYVGTTQELAVFTSMERFIPLKQKQYH